jgi:hypothetical protein
MNGKTTKQEYAAPVNAKQSSVVKATLGVPGFAGEPLAGFHNKTD